MYVRVVVAYWENSTDASKYHAKGILWNGETARDIYEKSMQNESNEIINYEVSKCAFGG